MTALRAKYEARRSMVLEPIADELERFLTDLLETTPRIDRISARAKTVTSFMNKAEAIESGHNRYSDPLNQIQDQVAARIVTFFLSDVQAIQVTLLKYLTEIEVSQIVPDSEREFGYVGSHLILLIPDDVVSKVTASELLPKFFELQIKTLFQHAWSEASHDIDYKPTVALTSHQKRRVAFTAAQAWGADLMFEDLRKEVQAE